MGITHTQHTVGSNISTLTFVWVVITEGLPLSFTHNSQFGPRDLNVRLHFPSGCSSPPCPIDSTAEARKGQAPRWGTPAPWWPEREQVNHGNNQGLLAWGLIWEGH